MNRDRRYVGDGHMVWDTQQPAVKRKIVIILAYTQIQNLTSIFNIIAHAALSSDGNIVGIVVGDSDLCQVNPQCLATLRKEVPVQGLLFMC